MKEGDGGGHTQVFVFEAVTIDGLERSLRVSTAFSHQGLAYLATSAVVVG